MKSISEYFDKIYCVNLDRRKERWNECLLEFEKWNIKNVERVSAVDGNNLQMKKYQTSMNPGELGLVLTNINIIKEAKEKNYNSILILEDDVVFKENANEMFSKVVNNVPDDWEYLFFGGNHVGGFRPVSDGVVRLGGSYAIHACGIKESSYDIMIQHLEHKIDLSIKNAKIEKPKKSIAADFFLADLQKVLNTYCFLPHMAWQKDGHSDIQGSYMDYNFLKKY